MQILVIYIVLFGVVCTMDIYRLHTRQQCDCRGHMEQIIKQKSSNDIKHYIKVAKRTYQVYTRIIVVNSDNTSMETRGGHKHII